MFKKNAAQQIFIWVFTLSFLFVNTHDGAEYFLQHEKKVIPRRVLQKNADEDESSLYDSGETFDSFDDDDSFDPALDASDDQEKSTDDEEDDDESFSLDQTFKLPNW